MKEDLERVDGVDGDGVFMESGALI